MGVVSRSTTRAGFLLFLVCLLVYLTTAGGSLATTDGVVTYELTNSLMHGSLAIPSGVLDIDAVRGLDGRSYSPFGIGQSIYNIPFYLAGNVAQQWLGLRVGKPDTVPKAAVALGGAFASAGAVWLTFLVSFYLSRSIPGALAASLILAFATSVWPYGKFGFNAPLTMLLLVAGSYALLRGAREDRRPMVAWSGVWFGAALLTRHEMSLAAIPAIAFLVIESLDKERGTRGEERGETPRGPSTLGERLRWFLPGVATAAMLLLLYNAIRFGNPFDTGHLRDAVPGFGSSPVAGIAGLLFSPSASLFLYSPPALLGSVALARLWTRDRNATWLLGGLVLIFVLLYSSLGNWMAGRSYGPRYLVPILPFLCAPLAWWPGWPRGRRLLVATFVIGALVQIPGVLVDFSKVSVEFARRTDRTPRGGGGYEWETAPIVLGARAVLLAVPDNVRYLLGVDEPPRIERSALEGDRDFAQRLGFSLDVWWLYLFYLGVISAPTAVAAAIVPLAMAGILAARRILPILSESTPGPGPTTPHATSAPRGVR